VIEQKVWIKTATGDLYPNLFIIFVGPAAAGKGNALNASVEFFRCLVTQDGPYIAPTSMTAASMTDSLAASIRKIVRPAESPPYVEFHSLYIPSRELGVLLPQYDNSFMNTLTDIYDGKPYRQTRRGNSLDFSIESPQINILAATTPSYLNKFLPAGAWSEGFISRVILVYSGRAQRKSLWDDSDGDSRLHRDLVNDLKIIGGKFGKIGFAEDAAYSINEWHMAGGEPTPDHPKLFSYVERRTAHLLKLCMIATLMRADNKFEIEMQDFEMAKAWLEEAEENMPDIFKNMKGEYEVIEEAYIHVWQVVASEKTPISEDRLWRFLIERIPSHNIDRVVQAMIRSKLLIPVHTPTSVSYNPAPRIKK
jgi:hypothetical protein